MQCYRRIPSHNELKLQTKHQLQLFVSCRDWTLSFLLECTIWEYGGVTMQTQWLGPLAASTQSKVSANYSRLIMISRGLSDPLVFLISKGKCHLRCSFQIRPQMFSWKHMWFSWEGLQLRPPAQSNHFSGPTVQAHPGKHVTKNYRLWVRAGPVQQRQIQTEKHLLPSERDFIL